MTKPDSLCCADILLRKQQSNTGELSSNGAGNTAATQPHKPASMLEIARNKLRNTGATQAKTGAQHKAGLDGACVAQVYPLDPEAERMARHNAGRWQWDAEDLGLLLDVLQRQPPEIQIQNVRAIIKPFKGLVLADFEQTATPASPIERKNHDHQTENRRRRR